MEVVELKKAVLNYIEEADERLLEMMLALAENYEQESTTALTEEDYMEMHQRRLDHLNEKSESYSWEDVKEEAKKTLEK